MPSNIFANARAIAQSGIDIVPGTEVVNSTATLDLDGPTAKSHV